MILLQFNLKNLNVSLQVGDAVYARNTLIQPGAEDLQGAHTAGSGNLSTNTGKNHYVGILTKIDDLGNNQYDLYVDNNVDGANYNPQPNDFFMFSKFSQGDSGLLGYYARVKFLNDSKEKVELFAVSSEIIINSN
jgi:hypothetical protein